MAEHEPSIGATDDWYTPPPIFAALGLRFALDPCSPGPDHWVPADRIYTKANNGLVQPWQGLVFMNPAIRQPARACALAQEILRPRQRRRDRKSLHVVGLVS
jgi:hypothetical protein